MGGGTLKQLPLRRSLGGSGGRTLKQSPLRRSLGGSGGVVQ